jgi:hypothetical protein
MMACASAAAALRAMSSIISSSIRWSLTGCESDCTMKPCDSARWRPLHVQVVVAETRNVRLFERDAQALAISLPVAGWNYR